MCRLRKVTNMHTRAIPGTFAINPAALMHAFERAIAQDDTASYPPINIVKTDENAFSVEMALAGFTEEQISISVEKRKLFIEGKTNEEDGSKTYLHKGIAQRAFRRVFALSEYVEVVDASMIDGMLVIKLKREVPEADLPRQISISKH